MDNVTIHGLPRIFLHKKFVSKLLWTSVFLVACGFLFSMLSLSVVKFRKYPFSTKTLTERYTELGYPSITFCDTDQMNVEAINDTSFPKSCGANGSRHFKHGCKMFLSGFQDSCVFNSGQACSFPKDFSPTNYHSFCYTFNRNGSLYQSVPDKTFGFELLLFVNNSNLHPAHSDGMNSLRVTQLKNGVFVSIHHHSHYLGLSGERTIPLVPGYYTDIVVSKKSYTRLPYPYASNCSSKSKVFYLYQGGYSVHNCLSSCFIKKMHDTCGDVLPVAKVFTSGKELPKKPKAKNMMRCFNSVYQNSAGLECDCPIPCDDDVYDVNVFRTPLRWTSTTFKMNRELARFLNVTEDEISLETYKKHIIRFSVYYDSFAVENVIEQGLYDIESLLSNFGGLMGLLTGASVISVIELIWVSMSYLHGRMHKTAIVNNE